MDCVALESIGYRLYGPEMDCDFFVKIDFIGDVLYCPEMDCVALEIDFMAWR
jgi:hypothetical protein